MIWTEFILLCKFSDLLYYTQISNVNIFSLYINMASCLYITIYNIENTSVNVYVLPKYKYPVHNYDKCKLIDMIMFIIKWIKIGPVLTDKSYKVWIKCYIWEWEFIPQQQPEQQPNVRWAHGRESSLHSSNLPCGRT